MVTKAVLAALVAFAVAAILTPLAARFARRIGAVDQQKDIGLARTRRRCSAAWRSSPARSSGCPVPARQRRTEGILAAAALITIVGALDDRFDLPPFVKFGGQIAAAVVLVAWAWSWTRSRSRSCTAWSSAASAGH